MVESEWDSLWITLAESDWAGRVTLAESENYGRITMTESEWHGRVNMAESEWDSLWITLAESDWAGRVTLAESENALAESPWPNPNGRLHRKLEWLFNRPNLKALVSAYALVAAVRNLAYQSASSGPWCVRCLGTCPAWLGSRLGAHRWSHPFCKLTGPFKASIRIKNGVYSCPC